MYITNTTTVRVNLVKDNMNTFDKSKIVTLTENIVKLELRLKRLQNLVQNDEKPLRCLSSCKPQAQYKKQKSVSPLLGDGRI